MTREDIR